MTTEIAEAPPAEPEVASLATPSTHVSVFNDHFTECSYCIHKLGVARKVAGMQAVVDGTAVDEARVTGTQAKLVPSELLRAVNAAERKVRTVVEHRCLPGEGDQFFFVRSDRAEEFVIEFNAAVAEFNAAADAIAAAYDDIVAYNREFRLPNYVNDEQTYERKIGSLLPGSAQAMRGKYEVEFRLRTSGSRPGHKYREGAVRDWFEAAHNSAIQNEYNTRRTQLTQPIEGLRTALAAFQAQLNSGDRLVTKSFNAFEESLVLIGTVVDVVAPELIPVIDEIRTAMIELKRDAGTSKLGVSASIKSQKDGLNDLINRVIGQCKQATSEAALIDRIGVAPRGMRHNLVMSAEEALALDDEQEDTTAALSAVEVEPVAAGV